MAIGVTVEVETRHGEPVVVKRALDSEASARLARERDRLEAARHPGVVEMLDAATEPTAITCAWAGGRSLETARPGLAGSVALLASVASTVADLHDLGIVHGRIEPSHVVIDRLGRPRLCGMAGVPPTEPEPAASDDVGGLGRLIELLVGVGNESEPIPSRRWGRRRWTGFHRRALQTLADQATDPDPTHRPTARGLARALAEVMPEARLAPAPPPAPGPAPGPAWPEGASTATAEPLLPWAEWAGEASDLAMEPGAMADTAALAAFTEEAPVEFGAPPSPPRSRLARTEPTRSRAVAAAVTLGAVALVGLIGFRTLARHRAGPGLRPGAAAAVAASASPAGPALAQPVATTVPPPPAPVRPHGPCPPVAEPRADVEGDGCPEAVHIAGSTIQVGSRRFAAGEPHDLIAVGDWDCNGTATPAVIRPATGEVFVFARWATSSRPVTMAPTAVVVGVRAPTDRTPHRCGPLRVRRDDGTTEAVQPDRSGS
ncbi:MAG: serine/threonine protein kinase [Acidimicrobiales bacterium]|nr:serine/threonine protein kinase [Acidimicrobiales bacterium]